MYNKQGGICRWKQWGEEVEWPEAGMVDFEPVGGKSRISDGENPLQIPLW